MKEMESLKKDIKLNFIEDKDKNIRNNDLLGTKPYVNTLLDIIQKAKSPFTIGLFGGWGTGKSSIIKTIEEKLNNESITGTKVFVYDAWKYSKDSFRRTFILQLKENFNLGAGEKYQNFYSDKHEEIEGKAGISKNWWIYLFIFIISIIFINLAPKLDGKEFEWWTFTISAFISAIIVFIGKTFIEYKISITKPKTFAPEQFEEVFVNAIQKITKPKLLEEVGNWFKTEENKTIFANRLVIVIDNIDRCHKELAFELLLTIKTFLEQKDKEIVFIIPIDESEIKKHINKEGYDGNEFLRKLFNTTLTIKKFSEDNLFEFTKKLQKSHKLDLNDDVLSLISQEFTKSPRKIIQFLNVLQTEIKLAEEQEKNDLDWNSNFKKWVITNNIEFLVKILLIREEWEAVYDKLKENPFLLEEINEKIIKWEIAIPYGKNHNWEGLELTEEQRRFFESTRDISTDNIEVFFANKDAFPDIPDDVPKLVRSQDWETVKTKYLTKGIFGFDELINFIYKLFVIDIEQKKLLKRSGFNIFSFIFKVSVDENYGKELLNSFYSQGKSFLKIRSKLNSNDIYPIIGSFNPSMLLNFIKTDLTKNSILLENVIKTINDNKNTDENFYNLLTKFIEEFKDKADYLKKIKIRFSQMLKEFPDVFDDFKEIFKESTVAEALISWELLEEFIKNLQTDYKNDDNESKINIINQYNSSKWLDKKLFKQYAEKIIDFLNQNNQVTIEFWLKQLKPLIKKIEEKNLQESIFNTLNQRYTFLQQQYGAQWNQAWYKPVLKTFLEVANELYILSKAWKSEIVIWLNDFFSRNEDVELTMAINELYKKTINNFQTFNWGFSDIVINKFNQLPLWENKWEIAQTLNLMLSKTNQEKWLNKAQIQTILHNYINNINNDEETIKKRISAWIRNGIIKTELEDIIRKLAINKKLDMIKIIKEIDKSLLKECIEEIITKTEINDLENVLIKLHNANIWDSLIKNGIKTILNNDSPIDENSKSLINFIIQHKLVDETISNTLASKIKPLLISLNKDDLLFALKVLSEIDIHDAEKRKMIKWLLSDININEFDDNEKQLYEIVRKKEKTKKNGL